MNLVILTAILFATSPLWLGWFYFRHYSVSRPPVGVFSSLDVGIMMVLIVLIPYLYLALPTWVVFLLFAAAFWDILHNLFTPILADRWAVRLVVFMLLGADISISLVWGTSNLPFLAINNGVMVLAAVGGTNLWAQSGLKARDTTWLVGGLILYDYLATAQSRLMADLTDHLDALPFAPMVMWGQMDAVGQSLAIRLGIGFGDLLMATVFPLVMRKAFGKQAGYLGLFVNILAIIFMLIPFTSNQITSWFRFERDIYPAMVILGPLMIMQYLYWRWQRGPERTTVQYLQAEPKKSSTFYLWKQKT